MCYVQINVLAVCDDKVVYMSNVMLFTKLYGDCKNEIMHRMLDLVSGCPCTLHPFQM